MNKADLINLVEPRVANRRVATEVVEAIFDAVIREVATGGKVAITGFGTFEAATRAPRTGRNPRTGEAVPIHRTTAPRFKPGTTFRTVVADPALLPAAGDDPIMVASLVRRASAVSARVGLRTVPAEHHAVAAAAQPAHPSMVKKSTKKKAKKKG